MGSGSSSRPKPPAGPQLPPQDPYSGHQVVYHHVVINASAKAYSNFSLFKQKSSGELTNLDQYFNNLFVLYQQGYRMVLFDSFLICSTSDESVRQMRCQGMFRQLYPDEPTQMWQLQTMKSQISVIPYQDSYGVAGDDVSCKSLWEALGEMSKRGGRLVCMTVPGPQLAYRQMVYSWDGESTNWASSLTPVLPVDIFFELPLFPTQERYNYQVVSAPLVSRRTGISFQSSIDWAGPTSEWLGTGWRLADIFTESSTTKEIGSYGVTSTKPLMWVFEKPASRMNDPTPLYQITMIEDIVKEYSEVDTSSNSWEQTTKSLYESNLDSLVEHMGKYGWEIVRTVETPDDYKKLFEANSQIRRLMFFQRRIVRESTLASAPLLPSSPTENESDVYPTK